MVLAGTSRKEADVPRPRSVFPFPSLSFSSLSLSCSSPNIQWRFHHRSRLDSRFVDIIRSVPWNVPFRSVWANKQTNNHRSTSGDGPTCLTNERENARPDPTDPADPALVWFFGLNECERRSATTRCCRTTTESVVRSGRNGDARKTADAPAHTHAHRRATTTTTTT
jgi:hypothetical protein